MPRLGQTALLAWRLHLQRSSTTCSISSRLCSSRMHSTSSSSSKCLVVRTLCSHRQGMLLSRLLLLLVVVVVGCQVSCSQAGCHLAPLPALPAKCHPSPLSAAGCARHLLLLQLQQQLLRGALEWLPSLSAAYTRLTAALIKLAASSTPSSSSSRGGQAAPPCITQA
jgi:hypothetical protein